jgi:antirestriction protein ArdC
MSRHNLQGPVAHDRTSLYAEITDKIIAELEAGRFPWVQPWGKTGTASALDLPSNASTGRRYSGINVLILWGAVIEGGFSTQNWLTFRQAKALAGNVRKGARGTTVVFAGRFTPGEQDRPGPRMDEKSGGIPFLRRFSVFNIEQCEGLPDDLVATVPAPAMDLILPRAEQLIEQTGADFRVGGARAYYDILNDHIQVPPPQAYFDPINWHRTACHELGHWTGHPDRLKRDLSGAFGTKKYAFEELVAEITAAFVCAALNILPSVRHADYIGSWLELLRGDERAIVRAASQANKAADYLLNFLPDEVSHRVVSGDQDQEAA